MSEYVWVSWSHLTPAEVELLRRYGHVVYQTDEEDASDGAVLNAIIYG